MVVEWEEFGELAAYVGANALQTWPSLAILRGLITLSFWLFAGAVLAVPLEQIGAGVQLSPEDSRNSKARFSWQDCGGEGGGSDHH